MIDGLELTEFEEQNGSATARLDHDVQLKS